MSEFRNVKIVGIAGDVLQSVTGLQDSGTNYENWNIFDINQLVGGISGSWSGAIKSSTTSLSALVNGTVSAGGYAIGAASGYAKGLTAAAFYPVTDENGTIWRIPLLH